MDRKHYHVAGVAGVGMSALAELLLALGHDVSGSDRSVDQGAALDVIAKLQRQGLRVVPQDGAALRPDTAGLLVSTAIEDTNVEMAAARRLGLPVIHRAEMLAGVAKGRRVVAVAGTAGKTTVTALAGYLLEQAGLDPTVVNGGVVLNWASSDRVGNVRLGRSDLFVLEVDESDRSLLRFQPDVAAILNASKDHFELSEVVKLFQAFAAQVRQPVILGEGVGALLGLSGAEDQTVVRRGPAGWGFRYKDHDFACPLIGRHNAENALMAVRICETLGCGLGELADVLPRFCGVGRRLELAGTVRGIRVIDDYAHNPAKIAASWRAVAEDASRVLGFWRPHGFGPLALMKDELADALAAAMGPDDRLYVLPVFFAGGTAKRTITSEQWVAELHARGLRAAHAPDYETLRSMLLAEARPGDAILGMGARDTHLPAFAREIAASLAAAPDETR